MPKFEKGYVNQILWKQHNNQQPIVTFTKANLADVVEIHSRLTPNHSYMSRGILKPPSATFKNVATTKRDGSLCNIEKAPLLHVT